MTIIQSDRINDAASHPFLKNLPTASRRFGRLQSERNALEFEYGNLQNASLDARTNYNEARRRYDYAKDSRAPNFEDFAPEVQNAKQAMERLQKRQTALIPRLNRLRAAAAACQRGLNDGRQFVERIVPPAADDMGRLDALRERREEVEALPPPLEVAIANEDRRVDKMAGIGKPGAFLKSNYSQRSRGRIVETTYAAFRFPRRELDGVEVTNPMQRPEIDDVLAWMCWFDPDRMKAHFRAELERLYERIPETMSKGDRLREMRRLDAEIADLQRAQCSAAFEAEELDIPEGVDAEAILGLEVANVE